MAARIRSLLGVSIETQRAWQSPRLAFNTWREAFERAGVLVFQAVDVQVAEMRGISIGEVPLPVVVVNIKDSVRGRIFSMFHEFVHILLRDEALCDMRDERVRRPHEQRVEVFCNQVAGAALVPGRKLRWEELVIHHTTGAAWTEEQIAGLAKRYSVSREVILRRLLSLGLTTEDFYREKRAEYQAQYEQLEQRPRRGFPAPSTLAVSKAGPYFTRAVLQSYYDEQINPSDVADYLEVRLKHLPQIERIVLGYSPAAGGVL
ncbi:MAG: ImmA/IrrE family metallo-endopeptidase [Gemmatimonadetes bacterium]|nr:ImmA/IrrE family metallo-endopeptidase [Gemmatimonadota bacterium]